MGKLICPLCGAYTAFEPVMLRGQGILVEDSTHRMTLRKEVALEAVTDRRGQTYAILRCLSCEERFVAEEDEYSEWSAVYPIQHRPVAEEIPEPIKGEFEEAHLCFAVGAHRGCVAMCEVALEAVWREQKASGLNELRDKGIISLQLYKRANEVRLWGNVAKHELIPDVVEKDDAEQLLTYLEVLLNDVYVEPKRLDSLRHKREQIERSNE